MSGDLFWTIIGVVGAVAFFATAVVAITWRLSSHILDLVEDMWYWLGLSTRATVCRVRQRRQDAERKIRDLPDNPDMLAPWDRVGDGRASRYARGFWRIANTERSKHTFEGDLEPLEEEEDYYE